MGRRVDPHAQYLNICEVVPRDNWRLFRNEYIVDVTFTASPARPVILKTEFLVRYGVPMIESRTCWFPIEERTPNHRPLTDEPVVEAAIGPFEVLDPQYLLEPIFFKDRTLLEVLEYDLTRIEND